MNNEPTPPVTWGNINLRLAEILKKELKVEEQREIGKIINIIKPIHITRDRALYDKDKMSKFEADLRNLTERKLQSEKKIVTSAKIRLKMQILKNKKAWLKRRTRSRRHFDEQYFLDLIYLIITSIVIDKPKLAEENPNSASKPEIPEGKSQTAENRSNLFLVREIRRELEDRAYPRNFIKQSLFSAPPAIKVLIGLYLTLIALTILFIGCSILVNPKILGSMAPYAKSILIFAALGSMLSLLTRIKDFEKMEDENTPALITTGALKPIIGIGFALVLCVMVKAGIIPLTVTVNNATLAALSFIAGFSERFVPSIIGKAEGAFQNKPAN